MHHARSSPLHSLDRLVVWPSRIELAKELCSLGGSVALGDGWHGATVLHFLRDRSALAGQPGRCQVLTRCQSPTIYLEQVTIVSYWIMRV